MSGADDIGRTRPDLAGMRQRYGRVRLLESDLAEDPFAQFRSWLADAVRAGLTEPNAMVLATVDAEGRPSTRHVLLKELDAEGFVFFTNHGSRKARDIAGHPTVALTFPWFAMERQVSVQGTAAAITTAESQEYWIRRPRESQLGAWASRQSTVIGSRAELEDRLAEVEREFPGEVPLPDFWGGYRVRPDSIEFWQGAPGRLHDRIRYVREQGAWRRFRLAP